MGLGGFYSLFEAALTVKVFVFSMILTVISLFIWEFYKSISKKDLINLDLDEYNTSDHPLFSKFFAILLYFLEYLIILPFLIVCWFAGLSIVLFLIAENGTPAVDIFFISATVVCTSRILAYFRSEVSIELAKLFPFLALGIFLLPIEGEINTATFFSQIKEIPVLLNSVLSFILVIVIIEIILRAFSTIFLFLRSEENR